MDSLFATLTPANTLAKMAFSNVFDCHFKDRTQARRAGLDVATEQTFDGDVMRFQRRKLDQRKKDVTGSFTSESSEVDSEAEAAESRELGMIWTGSYCFDFDSTVPAQAQFGWTVGKGRPVGAQTDFFLVTRKFAKDFGIVVHGIHARFNFHPDTSIFFVAKANRSSDAEVALDGAAVGNVPTMLTKARMGVRFGSLDYRLEYTSFSRTDDFKAKRQLYLGQFNASVLSSGVYIPPTPRPGTRTFAAFTLTESLGKGAFGKVFSAMDPEGRVVAIKILELTRKTRDSVRSEVETLQRLSALAREKGGEQYLLRLTQVLRDSGDLVEPLQMPFEDIGLVMEPVAPSLIVNNGPHYRAGMAADVARIFHGMVEAVNFLHSNGWMHGDLKKENIGLVGNPPRPILLDLGSAVHLGSGDDETVAPTPGVGGTVGYLAPERELFPYTKLVDVWAVGVIGYELTKGRHPWRFALNPWREGGQYEMERRRWEYKYHSAMDVLERSTLPPAGSLTAQQGDVVLVEPLLREMLRYPWAKSSRDRAARISASEALQHPVWRPLFDDERMAKRTRH